MARRTGVVRMGPVAIFVLVTVVCVAIMAVLSVAVSRADLTLVRRQASFMEDDYANETVCQTLYAAVNDLVATGELDASALEAARAEAAATDISGETELSAELEGDRVTARAVQPSGRTLEIVLERADTGTGAEVAAWRASTLWTETNDTDLWTGGLLGSA